MKVMDYTPKWQQNNNSLVSDIMGLEAAFLFYGIF